MSEEMRPDLSPDLLRGLTQPRLSRRRMMQMGGLSALGLALSACSIKGTQPNAGSGTGTAATTGGGGDSMWGQQRAIEKFWTGYTKADGQLNFANWPLYMDVDPDDDSVHPSLDEFTKKSGIKVKYDEVIDEDDTYYAKIAPLLKAGRSTGYDLMVITNGIELDALITRDYLLPLDQTRMPNFYAQASDLVKDPSYDRGNVFTMAWQSGITGIAYNPKKVGKKITSWQDLLDPALKGKIGMFADNQDLPGCALCAVGVNPETSTPADWQKAADWLIKQQPLVRKYYSQDYIGDLKAGNTWVSMAWSGDVFQANASGAELEFIVPKEGALIWTDNMCIPRYADHPLDAMTYMDYVYQPEVAATLDDYINYFTPVPAARDIYLQEAADAKKSGDKEGEDYYNGLANSPLIFPTAQDLTLLHRYRVLTQDELTQWNALFQPIVQA
ncbi:MAG TPA: spermidine/putrescine ABC transporter substrate-binding protein [Jatrophihabitans sp.]|jgi:spermidine/putrescine transport system substrate-binding protein